jgi:hypothetical protein
MQGCGMMVLLEAESNHANAEHSAPKVAVPSYVSIRANEEASANVETPQPPPTSTRQLDTDVRKSHTSREHYGLKEGGGVRAV